MAILLNDVRYVLRQLRKSPGFALTAILTLALGIGATVAIFSLLYGVLLRPLPYKNPSRLVTVGDRLRGLPTGNGSGYVGVTGPDIVAYSRDTHAFSSVGAYQFQWGTELSSGDWAAALDSPLMNAGMFPTLGVSPIMGRYFTQQEVDDHDEHVVVLSYAVWKKLLHSDPRIIGKKILLERNPYIVIGVMPRDFDFPMRTGHLENGDIWLPLHLTQKDLAEPGWGYAMIARLKPGVTAAQAEAQTTEVERVVRHSYPAFMANLHVTSMVRPLGKETLDQVRPMIHMLFLAVCVVLLIACANVAGLLLVRAIRRRKETAVRLALGSSAGTLMRQSLFESLALSLSGGLLGIGFAAIALRLGMVMLPDYWPRIEDVTMNWPVVAFAILLAVATGAVAALAPAFAAIHTNMNDALKEGGRSDGSGGHGKLRSTLVVAEITVALMLLVVSGLLLRSFQKLEDVNLGFNPEHVLTATYDLPKRKYVTQADVDIFRRELEEKLKQMPGVQSFALTTAYPDCDCGGRIFMVDGYVAPKGAGMNEGTVAQIEGDYFRTMGIPLLRGRLFTRADNDKSQLVVIVNRELAERYWPGQDPLGKRLRVGSAQETTPWLTVVGVVAGVKEHSPEYPTSEQFYQPLAQVRASMGDW